MLSVCNDNNSKLPLDSSVPQTLVNLDLFPHIAHSIYNGI